MFDCLKWALSPQQEQRQHAEAVLHGLELRPGFCSCLAVSVRLAVLGHWVLRDRWQACAAWGQRSSRQHDHPNKQLVTCVNLPIELATIAWSNTLLVLLLCVLAGDPVWEGC